METTIKYPGLRWLVQVAGGLAVMAGNMYIIFFASILPEIAESLGINVGMATALGAVIGFPLEFGPV